MLFLSKYNRVILLRSFLFSPSSSSDDACLFGAIESSSFIAVGHLVPLAPHNFEVLVLQLFCQGATCDLVHTFSIELHRWLSTFVTGVKFALQAKPILGKMNTPAFIDGFTVPL
ncbi:hypothetical protein T06_15081 [Trichinella sp. T6]|nr:hypothetical protein T06_15081 [Trichinella sp. T6]